MLADDHGGMMMAGQQNVSTKLTKKRRGKIDDMIGTMRAADTETVRENSRFLFFFFFFENKPVLGFGPLSF